MTRISLCCALLTALATSTATAADPASVAHPFIMWDAAKVKAIQERLESDPDAKRQLERMLNGPAGTGNRVLLNLFKYSVLGDEEAGQRELGALLGFIGRKPEPMTWDVDPSTLEWNEGMPSAGDRHQRDEQTLNVLRYDVLYDLLTPEQRKGVEASFRGYIDFHLKGAPPRHPQFAYDRTSWLPNMHWPRPIGTHLMAVALRDEALIKAVFESDGGFKWYFDEYIADGRFYMEEFGKYYSNVGSMIMYCEGLRRLGLDGMGWGYEGAGGATMKKYLTMYFDIGYPRVDVPGGLPTYPRVTMGDAKGQGPGGEWTGQHDIVSGYLPGGKGGVRWWSTAHMNGPLPKAGVWFWYEAGHARYPDAGFDYFLAQMRQPGEDVYLPSLYFNLEPIKASEAEPPSVTSYVAPERGFTMLRAEQSPAYWESPKPAAALQHARYYVHYVHDALSLIGYHAFNRPIYVNGWGGGKGGYAGGHLWKDSARGHAGVVVDNLKIQPVARKDDGTVGHSIRHDFSDPAKFVSVLVPEGTYPNVSFERALVLTDHYMLDIADLRDAEGQSRRYEWMVHGPGEPVFDASTGKWSPSTDLDGGMLYRPVDEPQPEDIQPDANDLAGVQKLAPGGGPFTVVGLQTVDDPAKHPLGAAYFDRGVGVRIHALGAEGTAVYAGRPPVRKGASDGFTVMIRREASAARFVVVHEPFEGGVGGPGVGGTRIAEVVPLARTEAATAVRVRGEGIDDVILIAHGDAAGDEPTALEWDGGGATFTGYGFVRLSGNDRAAAGRITSLKIDGKAISPAQ